MKVHDLNSETILVIVDSGVNQTCLIVCYNYNTFKAIS